MRKSVEQFDKPKERKPKSADEALQSLMRLCSRAEKSSGDALRLMRTWGVSETERVGVLRKLMEMRFIDDERYAEAYCREKVSVSGWGVRKIVQQLRLKGVSNDIISRVTATIDSESVSQNIESKLRRKLPSVKAKSEYELRGKLLRYGLGLGYDYDVVTQAIEKVCADAEE